MTSDQQRTHEAATGPASPNINGAAASTAADARLVDPPALRDALRRWYATHQRALPWRATGDPYAVWVSEVMLQQTRVATAEPYFRRWMARFPDIASLAAAPEPDVLKAWQGLGYYSRARNLLRAACAVVERHGGRLPSRYDDLLALPGIGAYTAGAVASIAFGARVPAVDGNARRVLGRVLALEDDADRGGGARAVLAAAASLADGPAPGDVNQAVMELGATICLPKRPVCPRCPIAPWCVARATGDPAAYPPRRRRAQPRLERAIAWFVSDAAGRLLIAHRAPNGLLGGLWEFPLTEAAAGIAIPDDGAAGPYGDDGAGEAAGIDIGVDVAAFIPPTHVDLVDRPEPFGPPIAHTFSHIALTMIPVRLVVHDPFVPTASVTRYDEWRWVERAAVEALPLSTLMRRLLERLDGGSPT
ncbi:MAG: A/G-specific adenine glycosylase [Ardenticatenales bacterium]